MDARRPWLPGRFEKLDLNLVALSDLACIERDLRVAFSGRTWSRGLSAAALARHPEHLRSRGVAPGVLHATRERLTARAPAA